MFGRRRLPGKKKIAGDNGLGFGSHRLPNPQNLLGGRLPVDLVGIPAHAVMATQNRLRQRLSSKAGMFQHFPPTSLLVKSGDSC